MQIDDFLKLVEDKEFQKLKEFLKDMNIVDAADLIDELDAPNNLIVFRLLQKEKAAEVFSYLAIEQQLDLVNSIHPHELNYIFSELFMDDKIDLLEEMPANAVKKILANTSKADRQMINQFLKYEDDTAGSIMTNEYVALRPEMRVKDAMDYIKREGVDKEIIYTCYVISPDRILLGFVSLRELVVANTADYIKDIMEDEVVRVHTGDSTDYVTEQFIKYGYLALPVVDHEDRMTGIITFDDVMREMEDSVTEDMQMMAAISPTEDDYLDSSIFKLAKNRVVWLLVLMVSATVTGRIIGSYEAVLAHYIVLNSFIPMLTGSGGNAGNQSSTLAIRNMAIGELEFKDLPKVAFKEIRVGLIVGLALGIGGFIKAFMIDRVSFGIASVIAIAMLSTVVFSNMLGGSMPLLAKRVGFDPAIMSSAVITTIIDAVALIFYFAIAKTLLPI
ncbi:MAG: magnesium transporter [Tissierellia bacterium]|nr:magnesium transporter [Tissierellia bacterium]